MKYSKSYSHAICAIFIFFCLVCAAKTWAIACDAIFTNGIQATGASGNINLSYHSVLTGGNGVLKAKTLTDNTAWVACSGSSCSATGTAATTSTVTFSTGSGTNGAIAVAANATLSKASGDYTTVSVGQQATLTFSTASGTYKTTAFTTNYQSIVQLQSGDYWINGNLTLAQETVLKRVATSGTTRIFVNGNITLAYKVTTQSFTSDQLLIYATGTITADNEANLSAFIYAGGAVSFNYQSVINGGVSGSSFTASGNEVKVNYQPSAFSTANFAPFCSGTTVTPVLLGSWNMDEGSWNGTANEVKDSSGNNNHGRASVAISGNTKPSTTSGSSAYTLGSQSTCRYGAFDGTGGSPTRTYDYVELSGFPTLPNGFTFAAWIRSTNASAQHQRILVRDDADNGWGLSLADGTGSPELRFFNRNVTNNGAVTGQGTNPNCGVFCVDTNPIIANNTWYYVAAVVDTSAQTVTLYVYSQAGVQQAKAVGAYSGTWKDGTGLAAIGGETSASSEGRQTSFHFLGNIDEVNIYSGALSQTSIESLLTTVRTCPAPDHYELEVPATNVTCLGADITVRACADSAVPCNQDNSVNSNVTLATNAGTLNATTLTLSGGSATTKLKYGTAVDGASATVSLSGEATAATNSRKCCTGSASCSVANSCATTFKTAGFIFSNNATSSGNIATQTAGIASSNTYLRAIQTSTTTGACVARFTATQTVPMAFQCANPATCISGETLTIGGTSIAGYANTTAPTVYTNTSLAFDAQGSAPIAINYSDVGAIRLLANLVLPATTNDPAYTLTGTSNDFVVKPYDLKITSVQTTGGVNNPATTQTGTGFLPAGTPFKVSVQAVSYYTGSATPRVTPNFGLESPSTSAESVGLLIDSLVNPSSGNQGTLANANAFVKSGTTFTNTTVNWSEVGTIAVKAHLQDSSYLGAGDVTSITAVNVGRFYPDHFRLGTSTASNGCSTFTYMGQGNLGLSYSFQAENINNTVVNNYGPSYSSILATPVYSIENLDNGVDLNVLNGGVDRFVVATTPGWLSGVLNLSGFGTFARLISSGVEIPDGSYESAVLGVKLTDSLDSRVIRTADLNTNPLTSGSCSTAGNCTTVALGSTLKFRYGRMRLDDAFGPESVNLPVNFTTEYWAQNRFVVNASDSCTLLPRSAVTYPKGSLSTDANRTVDLTGGPTGTTQGTYTSLTPTSIGFNAGNAGQIFTAPTNSAQGSFVVSVDLTTLPWLTFDWDQGKTVGPDTKLPDATFTFGSYRGNDRVIYWRERLQ